LNTEPEVIANLIYLAPQSGQNQSSASGILAINRMQKIVLEQLLIPAVSKIPLLYSRQAS
jgi:hypothetical protein